MVEVGIETHNYQDEDELETLRSRFSAIPENQITIVGNNSIEVKYLEKLYRYIDLNGAPVTCRESSLGEAAKKVKLGIKRHLDAEIFRVVALMVELGMPIPKIDLAANGFELDEFSFDELVGNDVRSLTRIEWNPKYKDKILPLARFLVDNNMVKGSVQSVLDHMFCDGCELHLNDLNGRLEFRPTHAFRKELAPIKWQEGVVEAVALVGFLTSTRRIESAGQPKIVTTDKQDVMVHFVIQNQKRRLNPEEKGHETAIRVASKSDPKHTYSLPGKNLSTWLVRNVCDLPDK